MSANTTRRALLRLGTGALAYGAGAAAVAGGFAIAGEAKGAETERPGRAAWDRALAAYRAAVAASDRHYADVEKPANEKLQRRAPFAGCFFEVTDQTGRTVRHRWSPNDPDAYETMPPGSVHAAKAREVKAAWQAHQRAASTLGMDAIRKRSNELYEAIGPAEDALFQTQAPDLDAVLVKLDRLWSERDYNIPEYSDHVMADVRRLAGREA
ncbi:hypothetical protein [Sphingomonas beigongshangi]|uniref:hypothetical protein n=1 Tax=Sphingomonas beigongshangi TaxID=2782540 RepID=UPI00193B36AA|nr:hypothetical protein [Sphingomonas beigongshangi]